MPVSVPTTTGDSLNTKKIIKKNNFICGPARKSKLCVQQSESSYFESPKGHVKTLYDDTLPWRHVTLMTCYLDTWRKGLKGFFWNIQWFSVSKCIIILNIQIPQYRTKSEKITATFTDCKRVPLYYLRLYQSCPNSPAVHVCRYLVISCFKVGVFVFFLGFSSMESLEEAFNFARYSTWMSPKEGRMCLPDAQDFRT